MGRRRTPYDDLNLSAYEPVINSSINAFRRLDRRAQLAIVVLLVVAGVIAAVVYYRSQRAQQAGGPGLPGQTTGSPSAVAESPDLLLGNPSAATPDPSNKTNYLMVKPYYALSYNDSTGTPNWVSWRVTKSDLGDAPRKQVFDTDTTLPPGFYRVTHKDYSGSGFDRGHMCPHSDRAANQDMSFATFVMTNIIPQAPNVNEKAWAQMESYCRDLVRQHQQRLYIVAGPVGRGGQGREGPRETLADGKVTVPAECWKIVVAVPEEGGDDDLAKITATTRVLSVAMPNDHDAVGEEWAQFRTSTAEVERKTGFHFFGRVRPDALQALRQKVDNTPLPAPRPMGHGRGGG